MAAEGSRFFFSYAREDSEIVLRLARELRKAGANVWLDQLDIRGGSRWDEAVQAALESCRGLVAVLSPSSVASQNFLDEVSYALEGQKQVIPLLHRECAIPFRLRRVQYVNFTVNYDDGFAELLRSMGLEKATESAVPPVAPALDGARQPEIHTVPEEVQNAPAAREDAERKVEPSVRREAQEALHELIASTDTEPPMPRAQRIYKILGPRGAGAVAGAAGGAILGALSSLLVRGGYKRWAFLALISGVLWAGAGFAAGTNRRRIIFILFAALAGGIFVYRLQVGSEKLYTSLALGAPVGAFLGAMILLFGVIAGTVFKWFNKSG